MFVSVGAKPYHTLSLFEVFLAPAFNFGPSNLVLARREASAIQGWLKVHTYVKYITYITLVSGGLVATPMNQLLTVTLKGCSPILQVTTPSSLPHATHQDVPFRAEYLSSTSYLIRNPACLMMDDESMYTVDSASFPAISTSKRRTSFGVIP